MKLTVHSQRATATSTTNERTNVVYIIYVRTRTHIRICMHIHLYVAIAVSSILSSYSVEEIRSLLSRKSEMLATYVRAST